MSRSKFRALRADLNRRFPERQEVIDGCLAAILAGEHVLLVGPPGTAKSALVRAIAQAFGGTYFERLLTKFSTPDEIFGPISLKALEDDRFERVITDKLPTVEFAFVDEVFKSSSAILNSLLTIMNERLYHNDGPPILCPLVTLFGASNELPEGGELEALYDRFLVRFDVQYLEDDAAFRNVIAADDPIPVQILDMSELRAAQAEVNEVAISDETMDGLVTIRKLCNDERIVISDRRWKRSVKAMRATAYLAGQKETSFDDLSILADILWREPKERRLIMRLITDRGDPSIERVNEIVHAVMETSKRFYASLTSTPKSFALAQANKSFSAQKKELEKLLASASDHSKVQINTALKKLSNVVATCQQFADA